MSATNRQVHMDHNHELVDGDRHDPHVVPEHVIMERSADIRFWATCNVPIPKMFDMLRRNTTTFDKEGVVGSIMKRKVCPAYLLYSRMAL